MIGPNWAPERPLVGIAPKLTDAELITLAVIQALLGFTSGARFIRHARTHLTDLFPYLAQRLPYNKRLRHAAATMQHIIATLARDCPSWHDDLWLVDSTPIERGRSRETVKRSDMAAYATCGYCASHSRWFWGLRLHLIATPSGLPVAYALTSATTDERDTALAMIHLDPALADRSGTSVDGRQGLLLRHLRDRTQRPWHHLDPTGHQVRTNHPGPHQFPETVSTDHRVGQPDPESAADLERHGGRKPAGICARILQRLLARTAAIKHNETTGRPGPSRSLLAYDH